MSSRFTALCVCSIGINTLSHAVLYTVYVSNIMYSLRVAGSDTSSIWAVIRLVWPPSLLSTAKDHRNQDFGHKSTTLEAVDLLLPLLAFPKFCRNRHLVFLTDSHPSAPENRSYNDAVNKFCLPKAVTTSARLFSYSLLRAGKNAIFSKFDQKTAYKNVPQHPSLWPLQGFRWLGKLFFDTTTTFGSTASVSQFDTFAATLQNMALSFTIGELTAIHRQLDDLIVLCKASSPACASFTESYTWLCSYL